MKSLGKMRKRLYICYVFFMVLDLRLTMKIGCRETTFPFFIEVPPAISVLFECIPQVSMNNFPGAGNQCGYIRLSQSLGGYGFMDD